MYQTFRSLDARSTKEVGVFRSLDEALAFLGDTSLGDKGPSGTGGS
jgi:hypothetical protein